MAQSIITQIPPLNQTNQTLSTSDTSLVNNISINTSFNTQTDTIETYVFSLNNSFIQQINSKYTVQNTNIDNDEIKELFIDPSKDLESNLITSGIYQIQYNFLRNKLSSSIFNPYFIKEISNNRTELRIDNLSLSNEELKAAFDNFSIDFNNSPVFNGFYLNFGINNLLLATNIAYDTSGDRNSILIKLYEPLPNTYQVKSSFWVVETVSTSLAYRVEFITEQSIIDTRTFLKGPNFNLNQKDKVNNSTEYTTYSNIFTSSIHLQNQLSSILVERRAELNTDYSDYNNFVFFSSVNQRLANFYYKASLIESYNNDITALSSLPDNTYTSSSISTIRTKISDLVTNFDGYDYYLYFDSSSTAWPKSTSTQPYTLYSTGSAQVITWYNIQSTSASIYDNTNQNYIYNIFPNFITEDTENEPFQLFTEMVGQLFDEIWLYTKAIENRQDGDNSLSGGISKDLVADALRSYGINIYQSSFTNSSLYTSLIGVSANGSLLPATGSEVITTYVTSSASTVAFDDAQKLIYKRLYHNLPYLLKKKGTIEGLRLLLTCFGVPDTILQITEFGGKNKNNNNDWDYFEDKFNYTFTTSGSGFVNIPWDTLGNSNKFPKAVEFRFKTFGLPASSIPYSQSLVSTSNDEFYITLEYTGSAYISGSYSASIATPYNQYANLNFYHSASNASASIYLPFFDGGWWSVLINGVTGSTSTYTLYAKNNIYDGYEGNQIGFQDSSSFTSSFWWDSKSSGSLCLGSSGSEVINGKTYKPFSGSFQEFRYYSTNLSESAFKDYTMNPLSIEGNNLQDAYNSLLFRASLGSELYTNTSSVHPSYTITSSFSSGNLFSYTGSYTFQPNVETIYYNEPNTGLLNRVSNKIKIQSNNLPNENVLSPLRSLSQTVAISESYSRDNNLLEVGFSPQNEIDTDIIGQYGYFNLGEYIGDPRQSANKTYSDLEALNDSYFKKYTSPYNYSDYVRLIKYFDNALFKMVKDFTPARTSLSTGIIIKPTILERSKYPEPQAGWTRPEYTGSIEHYSGSDTIYLFRGDTGGIYNNQSSSFTELFSGPSGISAITHNDNAEFYSGELSGTNLVVTTQSLQNNPLLDKQYQQSINDLQNLNVYLSNTFFVSGSGGGNIKSGTLAFNNTSSFSTVYDTSTYTYTPQFSFVGDVNVNLSGAWSNELGNAIFYVYLTENNNNIGAITLRNIGVGSIEVFTDESLIFKGINFNSSYSYKINYAFISQDSNIRTLSLSELYTYWSINISNTFAQSTYYTDPTIYTQQNFPGDIGLFDDYYAIYGNVYSNRVSNKYFDVDYSNGTSIPTNFNLIMSSSAIYAQVQSSNYTLRRHINPRYNGSKLYGSTINQFTTGDISYANKPVIERYTNYLAQYDYVQQGNSTSVIHILSLVDIDGNKIALNGNTNFNFGMLKAIFPQSSSISLVDLTSNSAGLNTSGSARVSASLDENNIEIFGSLSKTDTGLIVPVNFNPYIDIYEVAKKAGLI